jgi:hypothetical protein
MHAVINIKNCAGLFTTDLMWSALGLSRGVFDEALADHRHSFSLNGGHFLSL